MITGDDVANSALKYLDVPFRHQGRTSEGLDCAGLVILAHRDLGLATSDVSGYSRTPDPRALLSTLGKVLNKTDELFPGCVLLFRFTDAPQHLAILSSNGDIIHANSAFGKVASHSFSKFWRSKLFCSFTHPEVVYG